jgi:uncharacterized membrane protein (DUF485 family)
LDSPSVRLTSEQIDWESVEHSESFQELVHERRAFVLPRTAFFLIWYVAFIILAGYAPDFMAESVYQGLTVGYCLALTQFVMVWYLGLSYLKKADRVFEPLERAAAEHARSLPHRAGAPASETAPSTAGGDGSTGGVAVSYMYDNKPETARIVAGGDTITIFADQDGLPATFKRHEFMSANDRGQFSTGDFGQQKKGLL